MIDEVRKQVSFSDELGSIAWVESIYDARRVLSHRGGVISEADVDSNGEFNLKWRTVSVGENEEGNRVLRFVEASRSLRVDDSLEFSPADCQELAFSLASCADELTTQIAETAKGLLPEESSNGPTSE